MLDAQYFCSACSIWLWIVALNRKSAFVEAFPQLLFEMMLFEVFMLCLIDVFNQNAVSHLVLCFILRMIGFFLFCLKSSIEDEILLLVAFLRFTLCLICLQSWCLLCYVTFFFLKMLFLSSLLLSMRWFLLLLLECLLIFTLFEMASRVSFHWFTQFCLFVLLDK